MKIVYISSMLPDGHFSQILTNALCRQINIDLIIYADKNPQNLKIKNCGKIKCVWSKNIKFIFQIIKEVRKDNPDLIHIQHEFTMYGNILTALIFPILIFLLRASGRKIIVTIHAAVWKHEITDDFVDFFLTKKNFIVNPFFLKLFFYYVYSFTSVFANDLICHNNLMKKILVGDWGVNKKKLHIIPTTIPLTKSIKVKKEKYFFCFGYMVRRKGFENVLSGFAEFVKLNKSYKLIFAGGLIPGQESVSHEMQDIIHKLGLKRYVEIKGFVEENEIAQLYMKSTAVFIPAKITMGSSGPLYHAQSMGKCILASDIGHLREDILDMKDGILVKDNKWDKAFEFVVNNPKKVSEIEKNVILKASEKNPQKIGKKYLDLDNSILYKK